MRQYKAAVIALNNFQNNFPDSKFLEEAQYLVIDSEFKLAEKSITSKQGERYRSVIDHYKEFLDDFPESKFLKEAEKLYAESLDKVNSLKKINF
jgi:outer membrane protein assembly factor BamD